MTPERNLMSQQWSNLAQIVYKRKYARKTPGGFENWVDTVNRAILGNVTGFNVSLQEIERLKYYMMNRKAVPAGRGLWYSGTDSHKKLGGVALNNCFLLTSENWQNFVVAQDLLMLGGGVGMSVEHRFTSKLPKVKKNVKIEHRPTKDADFIVPDSREGWNELTRKVLKAFFETGRSFTYSTICVRGYGEAIVGFGGTSSGPRPLIECVDRLQGILNAKAGRLLHPIDAADIICSIGEMVVAGNVRRSAIMIIGDAFDKEFLRAKRWDLNPSLPVQRSKANFSVIVDDIDDVHPVFWKTYECGEAFGIINRTNIQKYGRMGELKKDAAIGVNPCGEACLEPFEPCNLSDIALPNLANEEEFVESAKLMHRWGKRVTCENYHHEQINEVVHRNRRIGTGITGCLQSGLFAPEVLDRVYKAIQEENASYSKELNIPLSVRTTTIKPSGTISKILDVDGEGIHSGLAKYLIQRIRFETNDPAVPLLREAGHFMEPEIKLDGSLDRNTLVVDFYRESPDSLPLADGGWNTWEQLKVVMMAQKYWADQSISVSVYYDRADIPKLKEWLKENLSQIKTVSFLCRTDHGYKQAPKEAISKEQYEALVKKVKPINLDSLSQEEFDIKDSLECEGGACPIK